MVVIAGALVMKRRWLAAAVALTIAVAFRDLLALLVPAYLLAWFLSGDRRDYRLAPVVALIGPLLAVFQRFTSDVAVAESSVASSVMDILPTYLHGGLEQYLEALRFSDTLIWGGRAVLVVIPVLALIGGIAAARRWKKAYVLSSILAIHVFILLLSSGEWGYYWGAMAQPLTIALAPAVFVLVESRVGVAQRKREMRELPSKVKVVVATRDDRERIGIVLEKVEEALSSAGLRHAVLVVDDASADDTPAVVKKLSQRYRVRLKALRTAAGPACALDIGLRAAAKASKSTEAVLTIPGCAVTEPDVIASMIERYISGADVVIASRLKRGARLRGVSVLQRLSLTTPVRLLGGLLGVDGVRDCASSLRLYSVPVLKQALGGAESSGKGGSAPHVGLLLKLNDAAVLEEVPIVADLESESALRHLRVDWRAGAQLAAGTLGLRPV